MKFRIVGWLCVLGLFHPVSPIIPRLDAAQLFPLKRASATPTAQIPWHDLDERASALAQQMLIKPTIFARGPSETFPCMPEQYLWLLDNPDRVVIAWRRLGAKCVNITRRENGRFAYTDEHGSDLSWETIHRSPTVRIWYAEGKVKPAVALPMVPVKAMVILRHTEGKTPDGNTVIQHQAELLIHTESRTAAAFTKVIGQSATKVAEQGLGHLQLFYSALSSYVDRYPDRVDALFRPDNGQAIQQTQKTSR